MKLNVDNRVFPVHPAPYVDETPKPYAFEYGVEDSYSGAAFGQTETSDAAALTGSYRVALPDGRTQVCTLKHFFVKNLLPRFLQSGYRYLLAALLALHSCGI